MACKILRIGVFFDGTGNSKIPDSSKGQMSNIAKLSDLYKQEEFVDKFGKKTTSKMLYTNGVGTYDSDFENFMNPIDRKFDKGGGGGGAKRINKMIDDVAALLDAYPYHKSKRKMFTKREIDVFGFSRGAAMARDFVNMFYREEINRNPDYHDVNFNFIGIYDTVGSFGAAGTPINMKPKKPDIFSESDIPNGFQWNQTFGMVDANDSNRKRTVVLGVFKDVENSKKVQKYKSEGWEIHATVMRDEVNYWVVAKKPETELFEPYNFNLANYSAKKIVHMTAHDEVRKNFPLTNIDGSGGEEWTLLGVHSDIGGGYPPHMKEEFIYPLKYKTKLKAIEVAKQEVYRLSSPYSLLGEWRVEEPEKDGDEYSVKLSKVTNNHLAIVTLNLMYEEAIKYQVPLNQPEPVPTYLKEYYLYSKIAKQKAYSFDANREGANIRNNLSHHPARDPAHKYDNKIDTVGIADALLRDEPEEGNDARYVDKDGKVVDGRVDPELADHVERAIYPNKPSLAISKLANL